MEGTSDTWIYLRYMDIYQIHLRYLRYMDGTSDTWKVPQIHGRYLRYIYIVRKVYSDWHDSTQKNPSGKAGIDPGPAALVGGHFTARLPGLWRPLIKSALLPSASQRRQQQQPAATQHVTAVVSLQLHAVIPTLHVLCPCCLTASVE